jgi:sulfur carrier protein ThiS
VNGEEVGARDAPRTPLRPRDEVEILHSIQGG